MIAKMITCLSVSHRLHTEERFIQDVGPGFAVHHGECVALFSSELDLTMNLDQVAELAKIFLGNYNEHECQQARIFSFGHLLYHLVTDAEGGAIH